MTTTPITTSRLTSRLIRCPLDDRAIVLFDPAALAHRRADGPGWWTLRDKILPDVIAGRLALFTTDGGEFADVEIADGAAPDAPDAMKRFRFALHAPKGRVFVGPASSLPWRRSPEGDTTSWGAFVELLPGHYAVDVERVGDGDYRLRFVPAADLPAPPPEIPDLSASDETWDHFVVRDGTTEDLLVAGATAFSPRQKAFLQRIAGHDRYEINQETGLVTLYRDDEPILRAPFQAIGSFGMSSSTWRWAWANETIEPRLRERIERVRQEGEERGLRWLAEPHAPIPLADVGRLAALATALMGMSGWYGAAYEEGLLVIAVDDRAAARSPVALA